MISILLEKKQNYKRTPDGKVYKSDILKGMPYKDISTDFISNLNNKDLNALHYNAHKFYTYSCRREHFAKYKPIVKSKHAMIIKEFQKRGLKHNSPLECK